MRGKEIAFFAVDDDLYSIVDEIEKDFHVEYVEMGRFETDRAPRYFSFEKIPDIGFTECGVLGGDHSYLLRPVNSVLQIEEFKLSKGGIVFLIDQKMNPASVELSAGGIFTKKEKVIVAGRVATISEDPFSVTIYKALSSKIKKKFRRIGGYYVGPKAEEKLKQGWRLVQSEKSPKEYDLTYSDK